MSHAVRRLEAGDLAAYRAIRLEALARHPEAFVTSAEEFARISDEAIERLLESLHVFAVTDAGGTLLGIAAFEAERNQKARHRGWLIQVYVRREARGAGIGRMLVEAVAAHAAASVRQLHLGVWTENAPAIALYRGCGFTRYGTDPGYLEVAGRLIDEDLMVRFLDKAPGEQQ